MDKVSFLKIISKLTASFKRQNTLLHFIGMKLNQSPFLVIENGLIFFNF